MNGVLQTLTALLVLILGRFSSSTQPNPKDMSINWTIGHNIELWAMRARSWYGNLLKVKVSTGCSCTTAWWLLHWGLNLKRVILFQKPDYSFTFFGHYSLFIPLFQYSLFITQLLRITLEFKYELFQWPLNNLFVNLAFNYVFFINNLATSLFQFRNLINLAGCQFNFYLIKSSTATRNICIKPAQKWCCCNSPAFRFGSRTFKRMGEGGGGDTTSA